MADKQKSVTVDLDFPVTFDGREIGSLTFRRMKAKDALVAEDEPNKARAGYLMFAALAGVDVAVTEELDIEDIEKVGEAIVPLMGKSARAAMEKAKATA
ncbi:phage tail assembly protein [Aurantimonas aggregata]|uniref:Phage tail assembly protein n=1 Tax=Aurantimonas aggregata TaxID=2047720 RepID=A0A6L9MMR9_9HYPH|nr:phage tail assembly protein [Aurantimonas aggregata]NDV88810.1 phage tail assembly protein [Aurantimonas aggregata]